MNLHEENGRDRKHERIGERGSGKEVGKEGYSNTLIGVDSAQTLFH